MSFLSQCNHPNISWVYILDVKYCLYVIFIEYKTHDKMYYFPLIFRPTDTDIGGWFYRLTHVRCIHRSISKYCSRCTPTGRGALSAGWGYQEGHSPGWGAPRHKTSKISGRYGILGYNFLLGGTPLLVNLKSFLACTPLESNIKNHSGCNFCLRKVSGMFQWPGPGRRKY